MITLLTKGTRGMPILVSLLFGLMLILSSKPSFAQNVASEDQARSVVTVENLSNQGDTVSGAIRNKSPNTVRDVQLFIRYTFLWKNEFHPGKDSPSAVFFPTVSGDIPPGGSLPFNFTPSPPLPNRSDGRFERPSVAIGGFTQVIQQMR